MCDVAVPETVWSLNYGSEIIPFTVRRQPQRKNSSIAIHVDPEGTVVVDAPIGASGAAILAAVRKRSQWIQGHVSGFQRRRAHTLPREYVSGEAIMYLGRRYRLKVISVGAAAVSVKLRGGHLEVRSVASTPGVVRDALEGWFRIKARVVFAERMESVSAELRWIRSAPPTRLQAMKAQWGSCSPAGRLTLNPWLVKAPRNCIDYVILHELCHLKEHNHSRRFFSLMDKHMPSWREVKSRLDGFAETLLNR